MATANLISIEYDDVVGEYLIETIEHAPDSFITRMLFDETLCRRVLRYFDGKTGAWNSRRLLGTHFFWGVDQRGQHERLYLEHGRLAGKTMTVAWEPAALAAALRDKRILPGMFLKFALILFYMGMKPYAGYGSANYLTVLKHDLAEFLADDYATEVELFSDIPTNNITSVPVLLQSMPDGSLSNYHVFDIAAAGGLPLSYWKALDGIPVHYFMAPNLNNMYDYAFNLYGTGPQPPLHVTPADWQDLFINFDGCSGRSPFPPAA